MTKEIMAKCLGEAIAILKVYSSSHGILTPLPLEGVATLAAALYEEQTRSFQADLLMAYKARMREQSDEVGHLRDVLKEVESDLLGTVGASHPATRRIHDALVARSESEPVKETP